MTLHYITLLYLIAANKKIKLLVLYIYVFETDFETTHTNTVVVTARRHTITTPLVVQKSTQTVNASHTQKNQTERMR